MHRPVEGRVLAGVATALADATGISVAVVRLAFIVGLLFGGLGLVLYAAGWALIPPEGAQRSAAERWLGDLTTPGRRIGAALIGVAVLIVLAPFHGPALLVGLLLIGAWLLLRRRPDAPSHTNS
jgi:phage shock protein PspC (stress-responsive transcriptional regulator)